jgi:hypothetical protein
MATNAAYCKTYRKRIYNFESRVQQTPTPIPPPQHDSNVNADAKMMNNEVNDFFDEMNDINGNQIEQNFFINNGDTILYFLTLDVQKYKFNGIKTRFNFHSIVSQKNDNENIYTQRNTIE